MDAGLGVIAGLTFALYLAIGLAMQGVANNGDRFVEMGKKGQVSFLFSP